MSAAPAPAVLLVQAPDADPQPIGLALQKGIPGVTWERVSTPEAFSSALARRTWEAIVYEHPVPGLAALDALAVLERSRPDVPLVVLSEGLGEQGAVSVMRAGARDLIPRSHLERLAASVTHVMQEAAARRTRQDAEHGARAQLALADRVMSLGMMSAGVVHDINNPLSAGLANLDVALHVLTNADVSAFQTPGGENIYELLCDVRACLERIRDTVQDLRLFARADDEKMGPVDVRFVLESSLRMLRNEIRHRATVVKEFAPVPPVDANDSKLGQVFLNVLMNAAQAIPVGGADKHQIRIKTRTDERGRALVEIEDTGTGMTPEVLGQIFTPFFTTKPPAIGTGLGLSICQRIISGLGGEITFDSEPNRGTRCRIVLPAAIRLVAGATPSSASAPVARRGRVLIVDDDPMTCTAIRRSLAGEHEVTTSHSGREALALLDAGFEYDVIVCDLLMPQMTGMDLYRRLESAKPRQAARMLFLSGGLFAPAAREFAAAVPDRLIEKPFDPRRLRALVNSRLIAQEHGP